MKSLSINCRWLLPTLVWLSISWGANAQLNIVGQNYDKPETNVDYFDKPICLDHCMKGYDGSSAWFAFTYPRGEKVYANNLKFYAIHFEGNKLVYGLQDGYYTLSGILFTSEEVKEVRDRVEQSLRRRNYKFLPGFDVNVESELYPPYSLASEADIREMLYTGNERRIESLIYSKGPYYYGRTFCESATYLLTDEKGVEYYVWYGTGHLLMVDYVEKVTEKYKGKMVWIDYPRDEYSRMKHNLDLFGSKSLVCSEGTLNVAEKKSYLCKDIVFDPSLGKVLAIVEDSNNRVAIPIEKIEETQFTAETKFGKINASCSHVENLYCKDDIDVLQNQITPAYALLKEENERRVAERQAALAEYERQELLRKAEEKRRSEQLEREKAERERGIIAKYGEELGRMILDHKVALGMTVEMCKESLGYPSHSYENTTSSGTYLILRYFGIRLHFSNGKLVEIERIQ